MWENALPMHKNQFQDEAAPIPKDVPNLLVLACTIAMARAAHTILNRW